VDASAVVLDAGSRSAPAAAREYLERFQDAYEQAHARAGGELHHDLEIAGRRLRLSFAGPELIPLLLPALGHLTSDREGTPDIEIALWDTASTGVPVPVFPFAGTDVAARGDVRGYSQGHIRTVLDAPRSLAMWHEPTARAVFWTPGAEHVPWYERAAPLRTVLHWSLAGPGTHLVHAAAVAHERAGVLLAGRAGSGKTTTALACLEAGMGYLGDDYVVVTGGARPRAYSLYATAKAASETLALLPGLGTARCAVDASDQAKAVLDIERYRPGQLRREEQIAAVVIPRVTPGECVLRPVRSVDALRALAPSTILQHSHESASGLAVMSELVRSVPAFELDLGDDIAPVPAVIAELLEERA
jgi:hypothetical protein